MAYQDTDGWTRKRAIIVCQSSESTTCAPETANSLIRPVNLEWEILVAPAAGFVISMSRGIRNEGALGSAQSLWTAQGFLPAAADNSLHCTVRRRQYSETRQGLGKRDVAVSSRWKLLHSAATHLSPPSLLCDGWIGGF